MLALRSCLLSEKRIPISDNRIWMKVANPIDRKILARVKQRGTDWVFSPADFIDLGTRQAVDKALSRMTADGAIRRVARGLYDVPKQHPIVGTTAPSIDEVAKAVAGKGGTVGPSSSQGGVPDGWTAKADAARKTGHRVPADFTANHGNRRERQWAGDSGSAVSWQGARHRRYGEETRPQIVCG
jgi:Family of unknown function (DUF6088)